MTRRFVLSRFAGLTAAAALFAGAFSFTAATATAAIASAVAFDADHDLDLAVAKLTVPAEWKKVEPKSRIVQFEFAAPKAEGADADGRVTFMAAGGSIDANIERWYGQFTQPDGKSTKDRAKVEKKTIDGLEVHLVDISGTFAESSGGPFAGKTVERPDYRMLAAIIVANDAQIFIKFTGPAKTIAANAENFQKMIESVKKSKPAEF
ncbi:MAG TPA: hypothetical protein VGE52_13185 [Pirellulales bacterium]